jgi:tRNA A-37 threonylcarbamoyl transferase component Bud32
MSNIEHLKPIDEGHNESYLCRFDGKPAFVKYYLKPILNPVTFLKSIDSRIHSYFCDKVGPLSYRDLDMFHSHSDKEVLTYNLWKSSGIIVPEVFECDDSHIVLDRIYGESVGNIIKNRFDLGVLEKTIEIFDKTRFLGKKNKNVIYFHSDPSLDNFMCLEESGVVMPIDSSLKVRSDLDIGKVDSLINLYFAYNLLNKVVDYSDLEIKSVFDSYKFVLPKSDITFLQQNVKYNKIYGAYCLSHEEVAHRIKGRPKIKSPRIYGTQRSEQLTDLIS